MFSQFEEDRVMIVLVIFVRTSTFALKYLSPSSIEVVILSTTSNN